MPKLLNIAERALGVISSISTVGMVLYSALNTNHSGWADVFFLVAATCAATWGIIALLVPYPAALPASPSSVPISYNGVEIQDARADTKLNWPLKAIIKLRNDSSEPITIGGADWIANSGQAQLQVHPEKGIGWCFWVEGQHESRKAIIPAGQTFRVWWGINPTYREILRGRESLMGQFIQRLPTP